jgi:sulfopyruvate decarboxylase alpha subunit
MNATAKASWPEEIFAALTTQRVRQVAYVPDAGHKKLIECCAADNTVTTVPLTTEEEGIALLAGAWLGGQRGALLMQSSGVGNCVNMLSLVRVCRIPLLMLVTLRGQPGEFNPWQLPMGEITAPVLELAKCEIFALDDPAQASATVAAAGQAAFEGQMAAAVLVAQHVVGVKNFGAGGDG